MILPYRIEVEGGEVYVFPADDITPCHDWTEDYISQGFCWLERQVAFLTLLKEGMCEITVELEEEVTLRADTVRAIQVPFHVDGTNSGIAICAHPYLPSFKIPQGEYALVYQTGLKPVAFEDEDEGWDEMWCVFTFIRQDNVEAKILRQDARLNPPTPLFTKQNSCSRTLYLPNSTWRKHIIDLCMKTILFMNLENYLHGSKHHLPSRVETMTAGT